MSDATPGASRRDFLRTAAAVAAGALVLPLGAAAAAPVMAPPAHVPGIQLYTVRTLMQHDVEGTLGSLARLGYKEVEFAGYFGRDPKTLRTTLDGLGLTAPSVHVPLELLRGSLGPSLDAAATLGHKYVVCPWVPEDQRTPDGFRRIVDDLARIGPEVKARGMQLAYHNHDFEFKPMPDGRLPYDLILSGTDKALVQMELDLYWITYAGRDPLAYIAADPARFSLVHAKDLSRTGGTAHMADVGQGSIDFRNIFAHAQFQHYFVERDDTTDPLTSARVSERALSALLT
ncbi:MAG TPA: sugar phosphate isomerase/epimerase [Gemmatirosa sp.]